MHRVTQTLAITIVFDTNGGDATLPLDTVFPGDIAVLTSRKITLASTKSNVAIFILNGTFRARLTLATMSTYIMELIKLLIEINEVSFGTMLSERNI